MIMYNKDKFTDGAGSFHGTDKEEKDYSHLNPFYEGTIFETIINDFNGFNTSSPCLDTNNPYPKLGWPPINILFAII